MAEYKNTVVSLSECSNILSVLVRPIDEEFEREHVLARGEAEYSGCSGDSRCYRRPFQICKAQLLDNGKLQSPCPSCDCTTATSVREVEVFQRDIPRQHQPLIFPHIPSHSIWSSKSLQQADWSCKPCWKCQGGRPIGCQQQYARAYPNQKARAFGRFSQHLDVKRAQKS